LIFDFLAEIKFQSVKGPPELTLPAAWQLEFIAQVELIIGCTSAENFADKPVHGSDAGLLLFEHALIKNEELISNAK